MAPGKSSSVTLQSLLPDRAYKVIVSAVHYTGESEITATTGRTGECIRQHVCVRHHLPSTTLEAISIGAVTSSLARGCGQVQGFAQQGIGYSPWKRKILPQLLHSSRALFTTPGWLGRAGDHVHLQPGIPVLNNRARLCIVLSFSSCAV